MSRSCILSPLLRPVSDLPTLPADPVQAIANRAVFLICDTGCTGRVAVERSRRPDMSDIYGKPTLREGL